MADMLIAMESISDTDPQTYKEAMKLPDREQWLDVCAAEVQSLKDNEVFLVVDRPKHAQIITSK